VGQIIQLVDRLLKQRVQRVAIKEHRRLNGTHAIQTKMRSTMCGLLAEIERAWMAERTTEGWAAASAQGRLPGRPQGVRGTSKRTGRDAERPSLLANPVAPASSAQMLGISRSTLPHVLQSRRLA